MRTKERGRRELCVLVPLCACAFFLVGWLQGGCLKPSVKDEGHMERPCC